MLKFGFVHNPAAGIPDISPKPWVSKRHFGDPNTNRAHKSPSLEQWINQKLLLTYLDTVLGIGFRKFAN